MLNCFDKKYLLACMLSFALGGHAVAQEENSDKQENQTEFSVDPKQFDISQTLTHKAPLQINQPQKSRNSAVKFSNLEDALYIKLQSFTHATNNNVRTVFAPLVVVSPFVRFYDRFTVQFITTQMIQNFTTKSMTHMTHDMYVNMDLQTSIGHFEIKFGNLSPLNFSAKFADKMPINTFFINALYMNSGSYFQRAAIGSYRNQETTVSLGYVENTPGFQFTGHDGYVMFSLQQSVGEHVQFGGVVVTNNRETFGNAQLICTPTDRYGILLQLLNLGVKPAFHATYYHNFKNNQASVAINGFKEKGDGIVGANVAIFFTRFGAYAAVGATKHNPLYLTDPESPLYERYGKWTPSAEIGIMYGIKVKTK